MSDNVHRSRRRRVLERLAAEQGNGALVIAAVPELVVGPDTEQRYIPDADLFWLAGYTEPGAVLVLAPSADTPFTLFVRDRDPDQERWTGIRGGVEAALQQFGADAAFPLEKLEEELPKLAGGCDHLFARLETGRSTVDAAVRHTIRSGLRTRQRTARGTHTVTDPAVLLGPLRRVKDEHEIDLLRQAAAITAAGFGAARTALEDARGEWEVEAALEHAFRSRGAMGPAFPSIVAGGANATVLHYIANDAPLRPGSALLIDAGARYRMYCGDISRTYPVGGSFTAEQAAVYDVVRRAHDAGIAAAQPGGTIADVHEAALHELVDGMLALGLLEGEKDGIMERREYRRYYPHQTSHWLGLDVHDAGGYMSAPDQPVRLEPGMVFTVEPGLYIPADDDRAPAGLRGIGVRIEDDVLVTAGGTEILTADAPYG